MFVKGCYEIFYYAGDFALKNGGTFSAVDELRSFDLFLLALIHS